MATKKKRKINPDLSYNPILDYETDWMEDPSNGHKQFAGESVQNFLKSELKKGFGYSRMSGNMLQHFHSIDDADAYDGGDTSKLLDQTDMSGKTNVQFKFLEIPIGSNVYINGSRPYIFPLYVKSVEVDNEGNETPTSFMVTLTINVTLNGRTVSTPIGLFEPNKAIEVNIRPYISGGASFTIMASDDQGNRRTSQRYNVVMASMYMEPRNNTWWASAYRQPVGESAGQSTWSVPLSIEVNVDCRLNARLVKDGTTYVTKTVLRENMLTNYDLTLEHPMASGGTAGVYQLILELVCTDESLQTSVPTQTLTYSVFCVGSEEAGSFFLANNKADNLTNYTNNRLFDYAVFGNHATLDLSAMVGAVSVQSTEDIEPDSETVYSYYVELEVERADTNDFELDVSASFNGSEVLSESFTVNNSSGYAATPGSVLFVKAAGRDNSEANKDKLFNIATGSYVTPTLEGISFSASDGWKRKTVTDIGGNEVAVSFFRILGGGRMELPVKPLKMNANEGRTVELMFQPRNVLNEDTPIITCLTPVGGTAGHPESFVGLRVTSSRITLLTANSQDEDNQSKAYDDAEPIHMAIVVAPGYSEAGEAYDACFIFINGVKQREFAYNRDLDVNANLVIDNADADVDWYGIRTYESALSTDEIQQNAANWKISLYEKAQFKSQCDIKEAGVVDFNKVRAICNTFVWRADEIPADEPITNTFPHFGMSEGQKIGGVLKTYWRDHTDWNKTLHMDIEGQGTTSMEYWRWNFKGSSDDPIDFDGGTHTAIKKLCGKKNVASSMQSHKMGGCEAFDYLARATGAVEQDAARQAIWQYPFVGFVEDADGNKTFIGLYTIGPDKGDKGTFGFGSNTIAMEGLDNDVLSANFRVPWNGSTVTPDSSNKKYTVCGEKSWEDSMKNAAGVNSRWKPAYNLVYECSQLIKPWKGATVGQTVYPATQQGLLDHASTITSIDTSTDEGKAQYKEATLYEYWITSSGDSGNAYKLFFYNPATHEYTQSETTAAVNLSSQLCGHEYKVGETTDGAVTTPVYLTTEVLAAAADDDARNVLFKKARISKFRKEASAHFDIVNAFFHLGWVEFDAATDNLVKNTYPYLLNVLDELMKIRWRQDDVDTVFPIENQGKDKKPYCVELEDDYSDYGMSPLAVFNGRRSQFWFTLKEAFADEYDTFMRETFIPALTGYRPALGILGSVMAFFQDFYFSRAQEYFGAALYNADSTYCYEQAHLATGYTTHRNIALQQLLGDHYSAEKRWIRMRAIYMMSKYKAGLFAAGTTADAFATRVSSGQNSYTLTPAIYMYPSVDFGQTVHRGPRFWPGSNVTAWTTPVFSSDGDQTIRFHGMSYLRDVGNLYNNTLKDAITVYAPMLSNLLLGNKDAVSAVASKGISSILIDSASTLRKIDLSRLVNLAGTVDLSACVNLRELYMENTAITQLNISNSGTLGIVKANNSRLTAFAPAEGVTLTAVELPSTLSTLTLNKARVSALTIGDGTAAAHAQLRHVTLRDVTGSWSVKTFVNTWLGALTDAELASSSLALTGINWTGMSVAQVLQMGKVGTKDYQGKVTLSSMTQAEYQQLVSLFGASVFNAGNEFVIDAPTGVAIASDKSQIEPEDTGLVTATLFPVTDGATIVFQLYKDGTMINPVNGIATVDGISLNTATGAITTTSAAGGTVKVRAAATVGGNTSYSDYVTILVEPLTYPSSIIITGADNVQEAGSFNYTKAFDTDDFTAEVLGVAWSLSGGGGVVAITSQQAGQATLAVSEVTENEVEVTLTCTATLSNNRTVTGTKSITIKEPSASGDFVDLGLPSGVKWATCNVGATNPEDPGLYFSWGNTEGHAEGSGYNFDSTTYNGTAAASISANLSLSQDAARANMGGNWRMPTKEETKELYDNTDREWTTINGMNGWKFMKKSDHSVFIFLPAAGYYNGASLSYRGSGGNYWSASFNSSSSAYSLGFNSSNVYPQGNSHRYYGFSVRAVQ